MPDNTRTVWLIRHGDALAPAAGQQDFDRALSPRGEEQVAQMARRLASESALPNWLWVSSAVRTQHTAVALLTSLSDPEVLIESSLYLASADQILEVIARSPDDLESIAVVGHNPGISDALCRLLGRAEASLPTLGCVRLTLTIDEWTQAVGCQATLSRRLHPED